MRPYRGGGVAKSLAHFLPYIFSSFLAIFTYIFIIKIRKYHYLPQLSLPLIRAYPRVRSTEFFPIASHDREPCTAE